MVFAATQTIAHGTRAGWLAALGFHLGGFVHILAAAFGVAILLKTIPFLYSAVKFAGAIYLIWVGIRSFKGSDDPSRKSTPIAPQSDRRAFRNSVLVAILNPKTALFYLAFLPQFTDSAASLPVSTQIVVLGAIVNVLFSMTDAVCIVLSNAVSRRLSASRRAERLAQQIGGGVLVAFGVKLAMSRE
jgi:threonine/homoserine/homoserine lactone efflux protein